VLPLPFIAVNRHYGCMLGITVQHGSLSLRYWRVRLCICLFSWELCLGVEYKGSF